MPDAGASDDRVGYDINHNNPATEQNVTITGVTLNPMNVSFLSRQEISASQTENTIIKLDDSAIQTILTAENKGISSIASSKEYDFTRIMKNWPNIKASQNIRSFYADVREKVQSHIGEPGPLSRQEVEFGIYWNVGPFGAYYKYKNGVMLLEHEEKLSEIQGRLSNAWESSSEALEFKLAYIQSDGTPVFNATNDVLVQGSSNVDSTTLNTGLLPLGNVLLPEQAKVMKLSNDDTAYWQKVPEYKSVVYNGRVYNIYVPWSGVDMNSGGWQTVGVYNTTFGDFSWSQFVSGLAAEELEVKPITETGDNIVRKHMPNAAGVAKLAGLSLVLAGGEAISKSWQTIQIQVITQEKGGQSRNIIQVGLNSNYFQDNAGKTVMPPATGYEGALNVLTGNRTFRVTLDARHAQDPFTAFISINEYGEFVVHPKVYSGDRLEVGRSGFWGSSDFKEIPMSSTVISKDGPYKSLAEKLEEIFSR